MSGLEFGASPAESLAWPLVVLLVAVLFRRQLVAPVTALVTRPLASMEAGPLEVVWDPRISRS